VCTSIEHCVGCKMQVFVATRENVADLLTFHDQLLANREEWESRRPSRWEKVWLPHLAYAEVVLEKLRRSPHAGLIEEGQALAKQWVDAGYTTLELY
jgi:hypothetical protein